MKVNFVSRMDTPKKGALAGTAAGLGASGAYLLKNRNDIFGKGIQSGIDTAAAAGKTISKNKSFAIGVGVCAAIAGGVTAAGALIGKSIGKLVENHNLKKTLNNFKNSQTAENYNPKKPE